jgi:tRNA G18 (ribose-2'-O)-methylase SpoU
MAVEYIQSLDDPRVWAYRNLKDRELARQGQRFIAEGEHLVRRLLKSDFPVESVLLADRRVQEMAPLAGPGVQVYSASTTLLNEIVGISFHSGVIACGLRKPPLTLEQLLPRDKPRLTVVVLPEISNVENIGSLIRISAAFGADAMLLGERCHDPFWRQSVRVSMGTIFNLPLRQSDDLLRDLHLLHEQWGMERVATVLDPSAEPLAQAGRPERLALLLGSEAQGLDAHWIAACDRRVTIPMQRGTDSLNVAVAAGIFLYHFTKECGPAGVGI